MNHPAEALFTSLHDGVLYYSKSLETQVRTIAGSEKLSVQQQKELEASIRAELESLAWYFLGRFDNVGCSLPPGVLGFNIVARPSAEREGGQIIPLQQVDIREGEQDYAAMWHDFLAAKNRSASKPAD
jgi:hypothetical protein